MDWLFRRRKPEENSTDRKDAMKVRDDLHDELGEATSEVDRLNDRIITDYQREAREHGKRD